MLRTDGLVHHDKEKMVAKVAMVDPAASHFLSVPSTQDPMERNAGARLVFSFP